jgi:competence protein ComEC
LEVTALDCGGGDALFLVLPDQTTLLMDAGGSRGGNTREGTFQGRRWDPGENVVSPYLWSRGIEKIDIVALSDAREEHLGSLAAVVRNFHVGEFWHGNNPFTPSYQDLLEQVQRRGITIREVGAGDRFERAGTSVCILWPPDEQKANTLQDGSSPPTSNGEEQAITEFDGLGQQRAALTSRAPAHDDSLVMRISNGEASVLLPGEISGKVEQELLRSGFPLEGRTLQVAHSGSKTSSSSEFLGRVLPLVALVSAEGGGRSDQQSSDALERLRMAGAQVYRTDLDGAVTVKMQAGTISVHTYRASPTD